MDASANITAAVAGTAPSVNGAYAHYGAAKAAIAHYTRYLAQDTARLTTAGSGKPWSSKSRSSISWAHRPVGIFESPLGNNESDRARVGGLLEPMYDNSLIDFLI
jgi:hypothetical protein